MSIRYEIHKTGGGGKVPERVIRRQLGMCKSDVFVDGNALKPITLEDGSKWKAEFKQEEENANGST